MTERELAIKKLVDAGGRWPPDLTPAPPWIDTGRWSSLAPRYAPIERRP